MEPEHVSSIIPRALNGHLVAGAAAPSNRASVEPPRPKTLHDLVGSFEAEEALENPDLVTRLSTLRMEENGLLMLPRLGGFALTDWARTQLASAVGCRWSRYFENATPADQADEMNRRLARSTATARLRTRRFADGEADDSAADGVLRAFVSSSYSPIPESRLARHLIDALRPKDDELRLVRAHSTDKTTSYVVKLGDTYRAGDEHAEVGDVWGGILVRNSGVGFASLAITLHLTRLLCKNGLTAPVPDALLMRRRHRGIEDAALRDILAENLEDVGARLHLGQRRLREAAAHAVRDVPAELLAILRRAELPQRLMPALLAAFEREPGNNRFAVSQAMTLAAQDLPPEERLELEEAAGDYIAEN